MKILQEITEWKVEYQQPNHVYLMEGDKAYGYVPWGRGEPKYFRAPLRIDRRGRKFKPVANRWGLRTDLVTTNSSLRTWDIRGSRGDAYTVSLEEGRWSCSCPGHGFRGRCRHVDEIQAKQVA